MIFIPFWSEYDSDISDDTSDSENDYSEVDNALDGTSSGEDSFGNIDDHFGDQEDFEVNDKDSTYDSNSVSFNGSPVQGTDGDLNEDSNDSSFSYSQISLSSDEQNDEDYTQQVDPDSDSGDQHVYNSYTTVSDNGIYVDFNYQSVSILLLGTLVGCFVGFVCWRKLRS